jgi:hypothetical protein
MQQEVDRLVELLKQDRDPERMQLIQENISVCMRHYLCTFDASFNSTVGPLDANDANTRKSLRVRGNSEKYNKGDSDVGYREEESYA